MALKVCPHCGAIAVSREGSTCIGCGKLMQPEPVQAAELKTNDASERTPSPNPYKVWESRSSASGKRGSAFFSEPANPKESFAFPAAFCSGCTPVIFMIVRGMAIFNFGDYRGTPLGSACFLGLEAVSVLAWLAAFLCGLYGLQGGLQRRAVRTILFAVAGCLLNFAMLVVWLRSVFAYWSANP